MRSVVRSAANRHAGTVPYGKRHARTCANCYRHVPAHPHPHPYSHTIPCFFQGGNEPKS